MKKLLVRRAFDQAPLSELSFDTPSAIETTLQKAWERFKNRDGWLPPYKRIEILKAFYKVVESQLDSFIKTAIEEGGKPLVDSQIELERALGGIELAIHELHHFQGTEIPMGLTPSSAGRLAFTQREPRGVVFAVSAFNHPFNLIIHQVIPAIAVGCPVLIKPSLSTPLSCKHIVEALHTAGLDPDLCQMILCENEITEKLVSDSRIQFLSFIGSEKVGWHLRSKLSPGAHCTLEHGGVAPVIVEKDAALERILPAIVKGSFYHAGQVCVSTQRIFVEQSIYDSFKKELIDSVKKLKVGDPLNKGTDIGPLIRPTEVLRVEQWVKEASQSGKILIGGQKISETCFSPTVVENPNFQCKLSQEEIFGPVVALYPYKDRQEAIFKANSLPYAFQAAVFTQDLDVAFDTAKRLKAQAVMINDHTAFRVDWMPFGGREKSGLGVGGIGPSMKELSLEKLFVLKSSAF